MKGRWLFSSQNWSGQACQDLVGKYWDGQGGPICQVIFRDSNNSSLIRKTSEYWNPGTRDTSGFPMTLVQSCTMAHRPFHRMDDQPSSNLLTLPCLWRDVNMNFQSFPLLNDDRMCHVSFPSIRSRMGADHLMGQRRHLSERWCIANQFFFE